ncbi:MATE family efflux transporter [uncultured Eubacterium sp.]|uniref:MATE family efflux transporter n=1 Tax=uncultured Eubacterium sp. TaxID=165185 RepID=UPI002593CCB8|nr:MATE family efflux transporter [uncultured Eubacterium sp.]
MEKNLTKGPILKTLLLFALPMMLGNLLQQIYNITDTIIVGRVLGSGALAAVGSTYTLMTFLTSVMIGLCMGCGALFSMHYGAGRHREMKECMWISFWLILLVTVIMYLIVFLGTDGILNLLQTPANIYRLMRTYSRIIFLGIGFTFLYNYFAFVLRAVGNSVLPLIFLAVSSLLNIALDLWFVIGLHFGVGGAAGATVIAQAVSGIGITIAVLRKNPQLFPSKEQRIFQKSTLSEVSRYAFFTCLQQSVMNFGILMIQGLVNSFGTAIMAAFAAAVKIDTLAYMPVQEFGNAFSLFISQNHGAKRPDRVKMGIHTAVRVSIAFCIIISAIVWRFARPLMQIFVDTSETTIIMEGIRYLHIEGAFYWGIGCLFLLYGLYRAIERPAMSLVLTIVSLGTRVALAYALAPTTPLGVAAIWWAIPIGWILADLTGFLYYKKLHIADQSLH